MVGFTRDNTTPLRLTEIVTTSGRYRTIGLYGSIGRGETREEVVVFYDCFADDYKMLRNED